MLEKAPDELQNIQCHGAVTIASMFAILESDDAVYHVDNPAVGDSHFKDIRRKVFKRSGPISDSLTIDHPAGFPDLGIDLSQKPGFIHLLLELCPKNRRERLDRDIEPGT